MTKVKLGSVLKEGKTKIGKTDGGGLNLIGVSNDFGLQVSRAQRIADLSRYKIIKTGWLAYNPMRVNVGSIGIAKGPEHEGIVSPDYVVFSCTEKILPDYLLFFLKSDLGLEAINKNASGAVRKRLYYSDLARIELNVPSIERQLEILGSVKKIEAMVSQLRDPKRLEKVSQLKQSILQEAIQGKLTEEWRALRQAQQPLVEPASELLKRIQAEKARLINPSTPLRAGEKKIKKEKPLPPITDSEKPFELPEGWEWCRPIDVCDAIVDCPHSTPVFVPSGMNCIDSTCVNMNGDILYDKIRKVSIETFNERNSRLIPEAGDIVYVREGVIGQAIVIPENLKICLGQRVMLFRPYFEINPILFRYLVTSRFFLNLIEGKHKGMGAKHINMSDLRSIPIPIPPLEEQKAIVEKVESLIEKCRALEEEISQSELHAQMLMQAVLKEAFEGTPNSQEHNISKRDYSNKQVKSYQIPPIGELGMVGED